MKKILYLCIALTFFACKDEKKTSSSKTTETETTATTVKADTETEEEEKKLPILTGVQTRTAISKIPYDSWFGPNYSTYPVDKEVAFLVKPLLKDVKVKLFMGTWCEDSQREVPQFFRIIDVIKASEENIEIITVDEDKMTPEHLEDGFDITNVPTFIFYKDGKELNRIVESPVESLEKDMFTILSGKDYKHTYAE
ncbi:thioredoxin family protein [Kordia algicida OT-1]|uniref:Na(+)-translocating NADH-quinone reductase subunit F n=1 Tax=Kordia algicida OT-1 TaxID=391587 RepID=A9E0W8_9FLAO|nr:thioredoxin family protein [Kordia algicida]EDP95552.1 Na(+)-translocating NADH-quinone reductase subunit F [Kordia algicida OT-1]